MATITLRRGDTLKQNVNFKVDALPYNMTTWTVEAAMQFANCTPVPLVFTWLDIALGQGRITLSHELTPALQYGEYTLRVRAIESGGDRTSLKAVTVNVTD